jgi:uncharacterized protein YkwD
MDGSLHRPNRLIRAALTAAILAGLVALAGCGGGSKSGSATAPVTKSSTAASNAVVTAQGTAGLVGPVVRSTPQGTQGNDKTSKIPPSAANHVPKGRHGGPVYNPADCQGFDATPTPDNQAQVNAAILCLVNAARADAGLPSLTENSQLDQAANGMAQQMVTEHFFSHVTPEGKTVVDRIQPTGYIPTSGDWVVGENLAWGSGALATPQAIVNGWMNSPGHKANILAPDYKDIGLATSFGTVLPDQATDGVTYVNDFGTKSGADPNFTLPPENGTSAAKKASVVVAGTTAGAKAKKARARHRARKRHHHRKHRRHHRKRKH